MSRTSIAAVALIALAPVAALATPATAVASADAPHARKAAAKFKVIAKVNMTEAVAGEDKIKVKGRVKPNARGEKIVLQQRLDGNKKWAKTDTAKIKKNGTFVLKDKPSRGGEREYRVLKPGDDGIKKGYSKPMSVTVWAWEKLGYMPSGAKNAVTVNSGYIATEYYYPTIQTETAGTPGFIEYTLGKKCTTLRGTYALLDTSATGSTGTIAVSTDGAVRSTYNLAVGTIAADEELSVTDVFRLRFDFASSAAPAAAIPAIADAEVLCS
ncbi:DUF4369 domain-containing protein [Nocardioides seonyuensis]|uniref:DUF4369 domain-containing protein n=1 Tax=Nocardioides seonyuensis TaxID=2518371 RepID=A0A4P7ICT3_9ACTN|nr:DUF4369 domain-containing protein [Nocardioides seonyuensis]QBX54430.1 DUF4369 domain-containing protein [Nocardioides seonyuensis]